MTDQYSDKDPYNIDFRGMNERVIGDFRASGGTYARGFEGKPLILLHHVGAKSGTRRIAPLVPYLEGDHIYIFASKAGNDSHPDWYYNLVANPRTIVEKGTESFEVKARQLEGAERDDIYAKQAAAEPQFADYANRTSRVIPVFALQRIAE